MLAPPQATYIVAEDPRSYAIPNIEPVHLWSKSNKETVGLRKKFLRQWIFASIELWILIFLMSTLYLGTGTNPDRYADNLDVTIVNFDGDLAGYYLLNAFRQSPSGNLTLNWIYKDGSDYNNNVNDTQNDVLNGDVWAIVVIQPNTTRLINQSLSLFINSTTLLVSPFVSKPSVLVTYEDGRNTFTVNNYVLPPIRTAIATASARYGQVLRRELINELSNASNSSTNHSLQLLNTYQLGSLLVDPLAAKYQNLRPGFPFVGQLATTLGYIYIYLISGMIVGSAIRFVATFVGKIHYVDLIIYRALNGIFQGFMISLIYSLIVLWFFGIDSGSLFMRYWMFNWVAALVFGMLFVLFTINLGPVGNSLLTAFAILMLAGATIQTSLELAPRFYRYGYGLPLYHIINGGRHLLFNSYSPFGLNVGVILIYFGVFWILAIITSALWLRKDQRDMIKKSQQKKTDRMKYLVSTTVRY